MRWQLIAFPLALITGCSNVTPNFDGRFGDAVREARLRQTLDPSAGQSPTEEPGMDGFAARESIRNYQNSFKEPPPVVNVINIGGMAGSK